MINNLPDLKEIVSVGEDVEARNWIKTFRGLFKDINFEILLRVKSAWFPALFNGLGTNAHGTHPGQKLAATESGYISLCVPRGTKEIKEAVIRFIPSTTGTIDWTANISYGGKDDDESASTGTTTANGLSVTDDAITEVDVTTIFSSVEADDQVGVQFVLDAVSTTTDIYLLGLILKYR